jgi:hypothetical protein
MNNERLPQSSFPVSPMRMCHELALKLNTPKHGCIEYRMAAPYIDMADVIQDAQQDGILGEQQRWEMVTWTTRALPNIEPGLSRGVEPEEVEVLTRWHLEKAMQAEEKGDEAEAYWHRQRVNDLEAAYGKVSM